MADYSYETISGKVYFASDLDSVLKQCNVLAQIAAVLGRDYAQQLIELNNANKSTPKTDNDLEFETIQSEIDSIKGKINDQNPVKSIPVQSKDIPGTTVDHNPSINQQIELAANDHQSKTENLVSSPSLSTVNNHVSNQEVKTNQLFAGQEVKRNPKKNDVVIEFRDSFNKVVEFKEVEVAIDHQRNELPNDIVNNRSWLEKEDKGLLDEFEEEEANWSLWESELEEEMDKFMNQEILDQSDDDYIDQNVIDDSGMEEIDQEFLVEAGPELESVLEQRSDQNELDDSVDKLEPSSDLVKPELIISDQEIESVVEILQVFNDQQEDNVFVQQVKKEDLSIIYQQTIDYDLIQPFHIADFQEHCNSQQLQDTLISLFETIDISLDQSASLLELEESFRLIDRIIETYNDDPSINQVIIKQIYELLYALGYQNPRSYIIDFIAQYGFNFLIKNLHFLLDNFRNKNQNFERLKIKNSFSFSNNRNILFILKLLKSIDLGYSNMPLD